MPQLLYNVTTDNFLMYDVTTDNILHLFPWEQRFLTTKRGDLQASFFLTCFFICVCDRMLWIFMNSALGLCRAMLRPSLTSISLILLRQTRTPHTCTHTHEHASTFCLPVFLCQVSAEPEHLQASGSRLCRHDTSTLLQRSVSNAASSPLFSIMLQTTWCFNNNDNDYGEILCLEPIATKTLTSHVLCRRCFPVRSWSRQGALQLMCILGLHETLFMLRSLSCAVLQLSLLLLNLFPMHRN